MTYGLRQKKNCIAMLLAGGQGSRLRMLTKSKAKPAVPFGGQYRIIDFSLSNCVHSGIDTVGVLTQYKPQLLNAHVGVGNTWDLHCHNGGAAILPPFIGEDGGDWYKGTAHAIYKNLDFIDQYDPEDVLILSGDHIYKMDYTDLLKYHQDKQADITIAVIEVPWDDAGRFGLMGVNEKGEVTEFQEKPQAPRSNLASMGVYVFKTGVLKSCLAADALDPASENDFGKNVIPRLLKEKQRLFAYPFAGYWKDVGTIESYWQASMDILHDNAPLDIFDHDWAIYSLLPPHPPQYLSAGARVRNSMISEGCLIYGEVEDSIIFPGVIVDKGAKIKDSVIMANVRVETGARIEKSIIGENTLVGESSLIGGDFRNEEEVEKDIYPKITVVEENLILAPQTRIGVVLRMKRNANKLSEVAGV
ncbi:MAG: glucose-1-phosphate adenylyltransferase [Clostridia bacterium]|jgi:glucose-1-phosphate adenylyltransferase|nr:glucose-1-phosphate adenylyltransferase [Clostridia bacterium]